jgi:ribA/ribD-fused uncharacterized protein
MNEPSLFRYFSKSKDAPPGLGTGERLRPGDEFPDITGINFRQKLSNFCLSPFTDSSDLTWSSVEHYFQAHKIHTVTNKDIHSSHEDISNLSSIEAKKVTNKKNLPLTNAQLHRWNAMKHEIIKQALRYKFEIPEYRDVLLNTKDAVISHVSRGQEGDAFGSGALLMEIRGELRRKGSAKEPR